MDWILFLSGSLIALFNASYETAVFWAPLFLSFVFWKIWIRYKQAEWIAKDKRILLEIRIPKEIYKPPQAMEFILASMDQPSAGSKYEQWWRGRVARWFSLEMVSLGGVVHFFINTPVYFKNLIETRLYSQYPDIEISEVSDYTDFVRYHKDSKVSLFGFEFGLTKPDPLPIKTYVDYGLDRGFVDEKQRFDPMTPMLEFLGSLGAGEQAWIQILVKGHSKRYQKKDGKLGDWRDEGQDYIKKIMEGEEKDKDDKNPPSSRLTKIQSDNIATIERNMSKPGLDCGIRAMYLSESPEKFRPGNIAVLAGILKQFSTSDLNGFKPTKVTALDPPWDMIDKFFGNPKTNKFRRTMFDAYRRRSYFYPPYARKPFVLTTEELATIFRPPSGIAETPTIKRIESKKTEPPVNLPA